ncbi:hypothetical protein NDU88_003277 [Pleurodeles waltl]|uniref:Uncharacterized protein n=1 Tax=Pleurodeles waltl TaxID=8319 RepID=A0AAV7LRN6_PLEWA|nr:hypothetical protein NDU88_003277 [Pleurodeles waltl]
MPVCWCAEGGGVTEFQSSPGHGKLRSVDPRVSGPSTTTSAGASSPPRPRPLLSSPLDPGPALIGATASGVVAAVVQLSQAAVVL